MMIPRACETCVHKNGAHCKHPLARFEWGRIVGISNFLTPAVASAREWPLAEKPCGYFAPSDACLKAFAIAVKAKKKAA